MFSLYCRPARAKVYINVTAILAHYGGGDTHQVSLLRNGKPHAAASLQLAQLAVMKSDWSAWNVVDTGLFKSGFFERASPSQLEIYVLNL